MMRLRANRSRNSTAMALRSMRIGRGGLASAFGSTGVPFLNTEVEIRREDGSVADIGEKGVVFARGP